jgi:hypothetical protein
VFKGSAAGGDKAGLVSDQAGLSAVGTVLMGAQVGGLLGGGGLERARQQAPQGGAGDVFHEGQIDVGAGALLAEGLLADDFAPTAGEFVDGLEIVGREGVLCHVLSR